MRTPDLSPATPGEMYRAALEMAAWADRHGFLAVGLSEHHVAEDGYLPSPLTMAGALAGRTERMMITVAAIIVPLHDPIRLAEDLAVLDLASGGRVAAVAGLGYRPEEYAAFGKDWKRRGQLLDEGLAAILSAWKGEPFSYRGRSVLVRPKPSSKPQRILAVGGSSVHAARRAARFGLAFSPALHDAELFSLYHAECERLGNKGRVFTPGQPAGTLLAQDPDALWDEIGKYIVHDATSYAGWQHSDIRAYAQAWGRTAQELRAEGKYRVITPAECIEELTCPNEERGPMHITPLVGGIPPEIGWRTIELMESAVLPYVDS